MKMIRNFLLWASSLFVFFFYYLRPPMLCCFSKTVKSEYPILARKVAQEMDAGPHPNNAILARYPGPKSLARSGG